MVASKTVSQLIAACPSSFEQTQQISEWFAECYRWAEIENYPELVESTWMGLVKIDQLNARRQYRETVLSQLKAIQSITVVNNSDGRV